MAPQPTNEYSPVSPDYLQTLQTTGHAVPPVPLSLRNNARYTHNGSYRQRQPAYQAHAADIATTFGNKLGNWYNQANPNVDISPNIDASKYLAPPPHQSPETNPQNNRVMLASQS